MAGFFGFILIMAVYIGFRVITEIWGILQGFLFLVVVFGLFWLASAIPESVEKSARKSAERKALNEILAQPPSQSEKRWPLAAPESLVLLRGANAAGADAFKLGILQLIWMGALKEDQGTGLLQKQENGLAISGSLVPIYQLCDPPPEGSGGVTIREVAQKAKKEYGSLTGFTTKVVVPELQNSGLYTSKGTPKLTPEGEAARFELEGRMSSVLSRMQTASGQGNGSGFFQTNQEPGRILLATLVGVTVGSMIPVNQLGLLAQAEQAQAMAATNEGQGEGGEFDFDLPNTLGRGRPDEEEKSTSENQDIDQSELAAPPDAVALQSQTFTDSSAFSLTDFDRFDTVFTSVDSGVDAGVGTGDGGSWGGDGGGDFGGGDCGGDCGGF